MTARPKLLILLSGFLPILNASSPSWAAQALVLADKAILRSEARDKSQAVASLVKFELLQIKKHAGDWSQVATPAGKTGWLPNTALSRTPFVSIDVDELNVRQGPGGDYPVIMKMTRHYPLRVLERTPAGWLKVSDVDGDRGWVSEKMVSSNPYVIARLEKCNVRKGPDASQPLAFVAEKLVLLQVLDSKEGWLKVKHQDGDTGWVSEKIVFGWLEEEEKPPAPEPPAKEAKPKETPKAAEKAAPAKPQPKPAAPAKPAPKKADGAKPSTAKPESGKKSPGKK